MSDDLLVARVLREVSDLFSADGVWPAQGFVRHHAVNRTEGEMMTENEKKLLLAEFMREVAHVYLHDSRPLGVALRARAAELEAAAKADPVSQASMQLYTVGNEHHTGGPVGFTLAEVREFAGLSRCVGLGERFAELRAKLLGGAR